MTSLGHIARILLAACLLAEAGTVDAAPRSLAYGGRLTAVDGSPVAGPVDLAVAFFGGATGGTALRETPLTFKGVALKQGVFAIDLALGTDDVLTLFGGGQDVWIQVTDQTHGRTYPRQRLSPVPYALSVPVDGQTLVFDQTAQLTVGAIDQAKVTGLAATLAGKADVAAPVAGDLAGSLAAPTVAKLQGRSLATGTPAAGQVLTFDGAAWVAATPSVGSGTPGANLTTQGSLGVGVVAPTSAVDVAGAITERGLAARPGVSVAGQGRLFFDESSGKFLVSENGGGYQALVGGSGSVASVTAGAGLVGGTITGVGTIGLPGVGTSGTYTKVATDAFGRVTAGTSLTAADLPAVPASQISGALNAAQIPSLDASKITTGTLAAGVVPAVPASKVTGTLGVGQLPSIAASSLTGTLTSAQLPPIAAASLTGTLAAAQLPGLTASQISGTFAAAQVPLLPASQIASGTLPTGVGGTGSNLTLGGNRVLVSSGNAMVEAPQLSVVAGNLGIGTTSAGTALDVAGALSERGIATPPVAPQGQGRIYFDATASQFMVSQNGGAYAPLGTVTGGTITQVSAGTGLAGGGSSGNVTVSLAAAGTAGTYARVLTDAYGRVTAGGTLTAADLPAIPVGLISGSLPVTQLTGTLAPAQLPALSESQITSGTLAVALGGTGGTSFTNNGVVVGGGAGPLSATAAGSQYQLLTVNGANQPVFGAVSLDQPAAVSGTLPVVKGGTGSNAALTGNRLIVSSGSALVEAPGLSLAGGNLGIGTTSAQTALDVAGVLTQRGASAPGPAPAGEGRIYFDATSNQFMVSQNGGAYSALGLGGLTGVTAGTGLTGGGSSGSVSLALQTVGTAGTYAKVTTDAYGRVVSGTTLSGSDLPPHSASLLTSGTVPLAQLPSIPTTQITGTLAASQVAAIPATQLSGTLTTAQLPSIPATQLSGTLTASQIPALPASQITSGTFALAQVGSLPASQVTSGTFAIARIPSLSATQIVAGTLAVAQGGTGASTLPANAVLLGNGASAPLSVAPSTSGNVLTSNGTTWTSAALPSFTMQEWHVTATGTWTSPADTSTATVYEVTVIGGGGGGGGSNNGGLGWGGGGGGGSQSLISGIAASTGVTVTIGAGGAGATTGATGGTGGTTSFGTYLTAPGGTGGTGNNTTNTTGGAGGLPSNAGALNVKGQTGGCFINPTTINLAAPGGNAPFGLGFGASSGGPTGYGAGGTGANTNAGGGGAGAAGIVVIRRLTK